MSPENVATAGEKNGRKKKSRSPGGKTVPDFAAWALPFGSAAAGPGATFAAQQAVEKQASRPQPRPQPTGQPQA